MVIIPNGEFNFKARNFFRLTREDINDGPLAVSLLADGVSVSHGQH
jgi:hypothetical protein